MNPANKGAAFRLGRITRRHVCALPFLLLSVAGFPHTAAADTYPNHPIKLIVSFPPGGGTDLYGRLIAHAMEKTLHTSIVVENRPGAAGTIGTAMAARAAPDGYTLLLAQTGLMSVAPSVTPELVPYKTPGDFAAIGLISEVPYGLFVAANSSFHSVQDLIGYAKTHKAFYASSGRHSTTNVAMEWLNRHYGIDMTEVAYKGGGPATMDLIAGRVSTYFSPVSPLMSQVRQGTLRLLAVTGEHRIKAMPNIPTLKELGVKTDFTQWYGLVAPKGTPEKILDVLANSLRSALDDPKLQELIEQDNATTRVLLLKNFKDYMSADVEKYRMIASKIPKDRL